MRLRFSLVLAAPAFAQDANESDIATPEAIVTAAYESIMRAPGEDYDWDRFRSLFLPGATLLPSTEQTGGTPQTLSPQDFVDWIDRAAPAGAPGDRGFAEEEVHAVVHRYGDVATVFSTYAKRFADSDEVLGRGINSFQLVWRDGRWWVVSLAWDEEVGAGPIPEAYGG